MGWARLVWISRLKSLTCFMNIHKIQKPEKASFFYVFFQELVYRQNSTSNTNKHKAYKEADIHNKLRNQPSYSQPCLVGSYPPFVLKDFTPMIVPQKLGEHEIQSQQVQRASYQKSGPGRSPDFLYSTRFCPGKQSFLWQLL